MGETYTGDFVLHTEKAQTQVSAIRSQVDATSTRIETTRTKLTEFFNYAMHMANLWGNYIAHRLSDMGQAQQMMIVQQGLQIASAEMSVAMTIKRGVVEAMTMTPWGAAKAAAYFALAGSMQFMIIEMERMRYEQIKGMGGIAHAQAYFASYGVDRY